MAYLKPTTCKKKFKKKKLNNVFFSNMKLYVLSPVYLKNMKGSSNSHCVFLVQVVYSCWECEWTFCLSHRLELFYFGCTIIFILYALLVQVQYVNFQLNKVTCNPADNREDVATKPFFDHCILHIPLYMIWQFWLFIGQSFWGQLWFIRTS